VSALPFIRKIIMKDRIEKFCVENEIDVLFADGFDDAVIGLGRSFDKYKVIYDKSKVIKKLMEWMTCEEAEEYFEYNIIGAYVGDGTPMFLEDLE